jgi:hypothetical protein
MHLIFGGRCAVAVRLYAEWYPRLRLSNAHTFHATHCSNREADTVRHSKVEWGRRGSARKVDMEESVPRGVQENLVAPFVEYKHS